MHTMLISEEYPPERGGIGVSAQRIAATLRAQGVSVVVATYDYVPSGDARWEHTSYVLEQRDEHGTSVARIGPFPDAAGAAGGRNAGAMYRSFVAQCVRLADRARPDVIHSFGLGRAGYVAAILARQLGVPHVVGVRGDDLGRDLYNRAHIAAIQFVFDTAAHIAFVASGLFRLATSVLALSAPCSVIHNGCDVSDHGGSAAVHDVLHRFPAGHPIVGMFCDVREKKGVLEVLRAVQRVDAALRPHVLIVGERAREEWYAQALANVASAAAATGTIVAEVGRVDRDTVFGFMRRCDVVVQASLDDGLPNTLLEAMALGRPVIASEIFRDDLGDGVAEYCDPYVSDSVVTALNRMLGDADHRAGLGATGLRVAAERFSAASEARAYMHVYEEVIRRHSGAQD